MGCEVIRGFPKELRWFEREWCSHQRKVCFQEASGLRDTLSPWPHVSNRVQREKIAASVLWHQRQFWDALSHLESLEKLGLIRPIQKESTSDHLDQSISESSIREQKVFVLTLKGESENNSIREDLILMIELVEQSPQRIYQPLQLTPQTDLK